MAIQRILIVASVGLASVLALSAHAQPNWRAAPTYTTVNLNAGFAPDPWVHALQAGGSNSAAGLGSGCIGFINNAAPDIDLNYQAGQYALFISAASQADTTLVILDPNGKWHCNDDAIGLNPVVEVRNPPSGNYNIWVGVHGAANLAPAQLFISEISPRSGNYLTVSGAGQPSGGAGQPNWRAAPTYGTVALRAGFTPDPWRHNVQAGGSNNVAQSVGGACVGYINASAPDVDLEYDSAGARYTLYFNASSQVDTTLVVLDPNGRWYCNDDTLGLDPVVEIRNPPSGNYNIWVGVHGAAQLAPAELRITEITPRY